MSTNVGAVDFELLLNSNPFNKGIRNASNTIKSSGIESSLKNINWKIIHQYHIICCESLLFAGSFAVNCTPKYTKNPTALYRLLSFLAI